MTEFVPLSDQDHDLMIDVPDMELRAKILYGQKSVADLLTKIEGFTLYPKQPEICRRLDIGALELLVMFRGYGKSSMLEETAAKELAYYEDSYVIYYSSTDPAAQDHVQAVLEFFERDELPNGKPNPFKQLVPNRGDAGYTWNKQDAILKNGNRISAGGVGKFVLGKKHKKQRPTLIIIDDPTDPQEPGAAAKTVKWLREVIIPMGGPRTRVLIAGVVYFVHDVIMTLMYDEKQTFNLFYLPAIDKDNNITVPEWWQRRKACCADDRFKCGQMTGMELAWQHIKQKKQEVEDEWTTQFMLQPIDDSASLFPMKYQKKCRNKKWTFELYRELYDSYKYDRAGVQEYREPTVIGCDHAFTLNENSDYSAFIVMTADPNHRTKWKIIDAWVGKAEIAEQKQILEDLNSRYQPVMIYSEKNNAGIVFSQDLTQYQTFMPIQAYNTGGNKHQYNVGLPSMKMLFESGQIEVPYGDAESKEFADAMSAQLNGLIREEGQVVSITPHDDIAMALWLTIQAAREFQSYSVVNYGAIRI